MVEQESISRSRLHSHYFPLDPDDNPVREEVGNEAQRGKLTCLRSHSLLVEEPSVLGEEEDEVERMERKSGKG